ncbi:NAD-dependent deacylase [Pontibacter sp. G13]|uniref:SIR2 family NAD-dependent protein deacylase n=1 Tax=Pontibacter sp. G13 TaxID=3074898 RepID=UPI00288BC2CD|nr:NAD-dependent deacylase [Pontibacter sp. G13]WNJ16063.1 NAD-dependent deacylase [Pontibacter sp. G13]
MALDSPQPKIVVLTGAGVSADSGIQTFRGAGGLWEGHDVTEVASPEGFAANPELVLRFYNERRAQMKACEPNAGHLALVELEQAFDVLIVTQNVDNLHERAGSSAIIHLHGELSKARSVKNEHLVVDMEGDIQLGDLGEDGEQLRPHIVWFGEAVPEIYRAAEQMAQADIIIIIGTSLAVYPAAGLVDYAQPSVPIFVVDPNEVPMYTANEVIHIQEKGAVGVPKLVQELLSAKDSESSSS